MGRTRLAFLAPLERMCRLRDRPFVAKKDSLPQKTPRFVPTEDSLEAMKASSEALKASLEALKRSAEQSPLTLLPPDDSLEALELPAEHHSPKSLPPENSLEAQTPATIPPNAASAQMNAATWTGVPQAQGDGGKVQDAKGRIHRALYLAAIKNRVPDRDHRRRHECEPKGRVCVSPQ